MRARTRALVLVCAVASVLPGPAVDAAGDTPPVPIPQGSSAGVPRFIGHPSRARPVRSFRVPRHPFMAPNGSSNIHNDAYMTDAYARRGPRGRDMKVVSTYQQAECASLAFDRAGRLVTICVGLEGPRLMLFHPRTLESEASLPLPPRAPGSGTGSSPFNDFTGGGYFYLSHRYRAIIPTNNRQIWVVREVKTPEGREFSVTRRYDLTGHVGVDEGIVSALPDWRRRVIWFVTTDGLIGTVQRRTGRVSSLRLRGEVIANSFAVDESGGVYIVSDHALYRFDLRRRSPRPRVTWRRRYDRGSRLKPGQVSIGSGTTPTLIGRHFLAITDNADPRMHVLVYRRARRISKRRLVCKEPVFGRRRGATDNSLIAVGRSLIVENNYGYSGPAATEGGKSTHRGIVRVKFDPKRGCRRVWRSRARAPSVVPKVSRATGLVYTYTKPRRDDNIDAWFFTAINNRTGDTVYRRFAGEGLGYNNNYAPISLGPDGTAYVGVLGGLIALRDTR